MIVEDDMIAMIDLSRLDDFYGIQHLGRIGSNILIFLPVDFRGKGVVVIYLYLGGSPA